MSLRIALLSALLLATAAAGEERGELRPHRVGFTGLDYFDRERERPLEIKLWYPATDAARETDISYDRAFKGHAAAEAEYRADAAPRPLVVLSHGDKGSNFDQSWLAEALAANGYVVAAVGHWMNTWKNNEPEATLRVWERPQDLSVLIDRLLADPTWGRRIDASRIGAAGHSSGGYTALALAGAIYSPIQMAGYCMGPERGPDCALADGVRLDRIDFSRAGRPYRDARVAAVFAMAPALGPGIEGSSLQSITVPVQIVAAENDEVLGFGRHAKHYASRIPTARLTRLAQGGHFVFMPECTFMAKAFTYFKSFDICGRRADVDRIALHARIAQEALSFFRASLPGKHELHKEVGLNP